jgi:sulfotransferase family protein
VDGPYVIGATGGSGTRVVARIVRRGGMFIGTNLNVSEDALDFGDYSDRWINVFLAHRPLDRAPTVRAEMTDDLRATVDRHLAPLDANARAWGWKEPRSIFLLPFFASYFPGLKFLHVVRDGRDMAYSANQNQLRKHGDALLGGAHAGQSEPVRSIALWSRLNAETAEYGETFLGTRYLRLRFEDLCRDPAPTIVRIFEFFDLRGDAEHIGRREVAPSPTWGRWRAQAPNVLREVQRVGQAALERFGYEPEG